MSEILAGKRAITPETAHEFAAALGTTPQYWMDLDTAFQLSRARPVGDRIARRARLRERFPVREMVKRGWVEATESEEELERRVLQFFNISEIDQPVVFEHAARRNYAESLSSAQEAWLFRVHKLASALDVPKYSETRLREALGKLELLMTEPEEIRHVPRILSECGVRFVIVEPIPGSTGFASGSTRTVAQSSASHLRAATKLTASGSTCATRSSTSCAAMVGWAR